MTTPTYKHSALTFGVEIETYCKAGKSKIDIATGVASRVKVDGERAFVDGVERRSAYDNHVIRDVQGREWSFMNDGSVTGGVSCEIVTPPLTIADMPLLQEVVRIARKSGARVNASCGIHVHIGAKPFFEKGIKSFNNLINLWGRFEQIFMTHVADRAGSHWCRPMRSTLRDGAIAGFANEDAMRIAWYGHDLRPTTSYGYRYHNSRYGALNLHNLWYRRGNARTIEFRCFASTLHAGKVRAYVTAILAFAGHALTARHVRKSDKVALPGWTANAILQMFRTIGLAHTDPALANVREHLRTLGVGASAHASPLACLRWAVKNDRNTARIAWPSWFDVDAERARLEAARDRAAA